MSRKSNRIPVTRRIVQELEADIREGVLLPGSRLLSVRDLSRQYEISPTVCLCAYRYLEKKGLVERRAGSGTFVRGEAPLENPRNSFFGWSLVLPRLETEEWLRHAVPDLRYTAFSGANYSYNQLYLEWVFAKNKGSEKQPGIVALNEGQLPFLASGKALLPLDDLLRDSEYLDASAFPQELLRALSWNGKLYALPVAYNPMMLFYNRRVFRQQGMDEPDDNWKWSHLIEAACKLTKEVDGRIARYGLAVLFTINSFFPFIFQNNGEFYDRSGNCVIDSDATFEALSFFGELYQLPGVCSHRHGEPRSALVDLLSNDLASMLIGDGVDYSLLCKKMPEKDWGVVRLPGKKRNATSLSVWGIGLTAGSRKEERFSLAEQLLRSPYYREYCNKIFGLPGLEPARNGVPQLMIDILKEAFPSLLNVSPSADSAVAETISLVLSHKMLLTREQCREFCAKINARL